MNPQHENILEKVRKLLRLADRSRGATENEAKVALSKAQELMTKYNIDSALFRMEHGETTTGFKVDKSKIDLPKTLNPADLLILSILQQHFNVKCILMSGGKATAVDIIGVSSDVDFAIYAFNYLRQTFFRCWNEYKATTAWHVPNRKSYYKGLHDGLCQAIKEAQREAKESYAADQQQTYALVLVDQSAAITTYVQANYGKLKNRVQRRARLDDSYFDGQAKGRTININQPLPG